MMTDRIFRSKFFWMIIAFGLVGSYKIYQHKTLGFSIAKISSNFAYNPHLTTEVPQSEELKHIQKILSQKYTFLASGSQSYAFVSSDGKYVVKFFRMKHLIPRISDLWKKERRAYQRENLLSIFAAHKLAYEELRHEAGLVFLHLNKTDYLKTVLPAVDKWGRTHQINLDQTEFVVQEKAELIFNRLHKLHNNPEALEKSISSIVQLVQRQCAKGIVDHDKAVKNNYGFVGDRPIHLDVGRLYKADKPQEVERIKARIQVWLEEKH
jgi:hypothetical protein